MAIENQNKKGHASFFDLFCFLLAYNACALYNFPMRKNEIPSAYYECSRDIDPNMLARHGYKLILFDLDNTLDPYAVKEPTEEAKAMKERFVSTSLRLMIASNNKGKRVGHYADLLGIEYRCGMLKPFAFRLRKLIKKLGYKKEEVVLIGDQIQTDVKAGNRAGITTILVEPLDPSIEPPWTRWNRRFDKPKRAKLKEQGLLKPLE